jgi:hypothetical protein
MNSPSPLFDFIFALWPSPAEMANDMHVSLPGARRWIVRGKIPMAYWPLLIHLCAEKFGRHITLESLIAASLARKGAGDRRVRELRLYPRGKRTDAQEAA